MTLFYGLSFIEKLQQRRLERRIDAFAAKHFPGVAVDAGAVIDEAAAALIVEEFNGNYTGPIADLFVRLIQDMIENPEKWIKIIQTIIALFASED